MASMNRQFVQKTNPDSEKPFLPGLGSGRNLSNRNEPEWHPRAGGIISNIAPALVRKGVDRSTPLDRDIVEPSNLHRQRFYENDIGKNKALASLRTCNGEC